MTSAEEFAGFARVMSPRLRRTAFLLCGDWHTAEDLAQTALTKVFVSWRRIRRQDAVHAYTHRTLIGAGARARGVWVGEDGVGSRSRPLFHVPDFGKLTFKNCLVNGKALADWRPHAYQRVNSRGTVQISIGGFRPGGTAFTTRYRHS